MALTGSTLLLGQDCFPLLIVLALDLVLLVVTCKATLYSYLGSLIAVEECSVDFHAFNFTGSDAQPNDNPVERFRIMSSRFPAIVPRSCVRKHAGLVHGCGRGCEVLGLGKPFVGEAENTRTEWFGYEIYTEAKLNPCLLD